MAPEELDLVSTDDLTNALARRSEGCVVIFHQRLEGKGDIFEIRWRGGLVLAMGLVERGRLRLKTEALKHVDEDGGE